MKRTNLRQEGFVSIIIAMVLIAIISLVTLGFAYLAQQNQRNALNRQLSTQAFYAAESGVNDAVKNLSTIGDVTSCDDTSRVGTGTINATNNVQYTCVLINTSPDNLVYDSISDKESTVVRITTSTPVANIKFSWGDPAGPTMYAPTGTATTFPLPNQPTYGGTCGTGCDAFTANYPNTIGILRTTIIPTSAATSSDNLLNGAQNIFMYPASATTGNTGGNFAFRSGGALSTEGNFASGRCFSTNIPLACNVLVTGLNSSDFYIRMKAMYKPVKVYILAVDAANAPVKLQGAQAIVDATGRAQDVVRRIQVRVPLSPGYYFPEFGIESGNTICKRLSVFPGGTSVVAPTASLNGYNDSDKDEKACQIPGDAQPTFPY